MNGATHQNSLANVNNKSRDSTPNKLPAFTDFSQKRGCSSLLMANKEKLASENQIEVTTNITTTSIDLTNDDNSIGNEINTLPNQLLCKSSPQKDNGANAITTQEAVGTGTTMALSVNLGDGDKFLNKASKINSKNNKSSNKTNKDQLQHVNVDDKEIIRNNNFMNPQGDEHYCYNDDKLNNFRSRADVHLKRLWHDLPCPKFDANLLKDGVIKNTKRMRFETKIIDLTDDDD